jgi:hypothetical protein
VDVRWFCYLIRKTSRRYNQVSVELLSIIFHFQIYRNEGVWPIRVGLPSFDRYREMRKDTIPNFGLAQQSVLLKIEN